MYYLFANIIILNMVVFFMKKRLSKIDYYTTVFFALFLNSFVDVFLDFKYDLYGFFRHGVDWQYSFILFGVLPQASIIFINYYPFSGGKLQQVKYILQTSILFTMWEWITSYTWVFYYNGWNPMYSLLCYPLIFLILVLNYHFVRHLLQK